jgi:hypothetical protein
MSQEPKFNIADFEELLGPGWSEGARLVAQASSAPVLVLQPGYIDLEQNTPVEVILEMMLTRGLRHCVQTDGFNVEREIRASARMVGDVCGFFESPLSSILDPLNASVSREGEMTVFSREFSKSGEKKSMLRDLDHRLTQRGLRESCTEEVHKIADEFFTNAVFNAPFVDQLRVGQHGISRAVESHMPSGCVGLLSVGLSGDEMVVMCRDPFGSLDVEKLLKRLRRCYVEGLDRTMNMGQGGAGVGAFMVLEACVSLYLAVRPGRETVVACVLPVNMSRKKRSSLSKNIHAYVGQHEGEVGHGAVEGQSKARR